MAGIVDKKPEIDTKALIGKEINGIILMELVGRGAMGAVFVGYQKSLKRKVAVKIFPKSASDNGRYKICFREEAEIVAGLNHQNIVPVYDMGDTGEFLFIIMQLVIGEDLRTMLKRHRPHPVPSRRQIATGTVLSIMVPVLDALAYAHEEGVIHQDIKPGNILIEERSNRPFLADFGIARSAMNEQYESNMIMGTPLYIAPELIREEPTDPRSDIYSAGTVLYEAIAGKLPFQQTTVEALLNIKLNTPDELYTQAPSDYCRQIDSELEKIILKAIAPDINNRYSSCRAFYDHLYNYQMNRFGRGGI